MSNSWTDYTAQALGASGFCVLHGATAYAQRPDLWTTPTRAAVELTNHRDTLVRELGPRVRVWAWAWIGNGNPVPVAAMSARNLDERMGDILGKPVRLEIVAGPADLFERPAPKPQAHGTVPDVPSWPCSARDKALQEKIPEHDCPRRKQMLAERGAQ